MVSRTNRGAISSTSPMTITSSASRSSSTFLPNSSRSPLWNSLSPDAFFFHCHGLDLLVMAALKVTGNRGLELEKDTMGEIIGEGENEEKKSNKKKKKKKVDKEIGIEVGLKPKRGRRQMAMPSKFQDSVLQPWKRATRGRRSVVAK